MTREVLLLREKEIRFLLDPASCLQAVEEAFTAYACGQASLPSVINLDVPENRGEIHIKSGHLHGGSHYAVKIASGFPGNSALGISPNDGMILLFDARTGALAALLLDNGFITDQRTGSAGGVAARHLSRSDLRVVAVIGCGAQARYQVESLALVRSFEEVRVFGRDPERARACADELAGKAGMPEGSRFVPVSSARDAVEGSDLVITVTSSRAPLVRAAWLAPGMHITAVGSDGPDKQELEAQVLKRADILVADSSPQCLRLGEIHHGVSTGAITEDDITAELGEITAGRKPIHRAPEQITVCDLTGVGVQDVAAARLVLARASAAGVGERITL